MARTHKSILTEALGIFYDAENARKGLESRWLANLNQMKRIDDELRRRAKKNRAAIYVPATYWTIWSMAPKVVLSLLSQQPYVVVFPRPGTPVEKAAAMQYLLNAQLSSREVNIRRRALDFILTLAIYGFGATYVGWRKEYRTRRFRNRDGRVDRKNYLAADYPDVVVYDAFSVYVDPYASTKDDVEVVITRQYLSEKALQRLAQRVDVDGRPIFKIPRDLARDGMTPPEWYVQKKQLEGWQVGDVRAGRHELLRIWTADGVTSILDRRHVIQYETENPFWHGRIPFILGSYDAMPGEIVGDALAEVMSDLQALINAQTNQRLDNVNLVLNKMFKVLRGADIDEDELYPRPGGIVHVDSHDDIQEFTFTDVTQSAYLEVEHTLQNIERTTGVFRFTMGQPLTKRQTATEAVAVQSNADARVELRVGLLADEWFAPLVEMMADCNQQFLAPETVIKVMGPHGLPMLMPISPEDIEGEFEFEYRGASVDDVASRTQKVNQMIQLLPVAMQAAQSGVQIDIGAYLHRILELAQVGDLGRIFTGATPMAQGTSPAVPGQIGLPTTPLGTPTMRIGPTAEEVSAPGQPLGG